MKKEIKKEVKKTQLIDNQKGKVFENIDIFSDIDDSLDDGEQKFNSNDNSSKELSPELKAAMVLNNIDQYEAILLRLYSTFEPRTKGGLGDNDKNFVSKQSVQKLGNVQNDLATLIRRGRKPISWEEETGQYKTVEVTDRKAIAKWQNRRKNRFIISSESNGVLSQRGKEQIEFLARMIAGKPDTNQPIEIFLLNGPYKDLVVENADFVLTDFYKVAAINILATALKRANKKVDPQLEEFIDLGVEKAVEAAKAGKYITSKGNFGAWLFQIVKNNAIDLLKPQTHFSLDANYVYDLLNSMPGPLIIQSSLNPKEAYGSYNDVKENTKYKTSKGEPYFDYIYNNPIDALSDFEAPKQKNAEGGEEGSEEKANYEKSPLQARYLLNPGKFYKGFRKSLQGSAFDVSGSVEQNQARLDVKKLPQEAQTEMVKILRQNYTEIMQEVKVENVKTKSIERDVPGRAEKKIGFKTEWTATEYEPANILLMLMLLQYGDMVPVYSKSFKPSGKGGVREIGSPVAIDKKTGLFLAGERQFESGEEKGVETFVPTIENGFITYTWQNRRDFTADSGPMSELVTRFYSIAQKRNLALPAMFFKVDANGKLDVALAKRYVSAIYAGLRSYFGFVNNSTEIAKKNRNVLNKLLQNISIAEEPVEKGKTSSTLNESEINSIRKLIRKNILESYKQLK